MEFSTITFFKVVFWLLSPLLLLCAIAFIMGIIIAVIMPFIPGSSLTASTKPKPESLKQENKCKEPEKKKKTMWQRAMEQQKKENARQSALARQAEQVRLAQAQSEHYKQFGIGY